MERVTLADGSAVSYGRYGSGSPLVLVHGSVSDHITAWEAVKSPLGEKFSVHAMARRGRGETTAPTERRLEDEFEDVAALVESVGEPVFLLGHSYGAHCAMGGATLRPEFVRKLVLYEPPRPGALPADAMAKMEDAAAREDWDSFVRTFLIRGPGMPEQVVNALQASPIWPPRIADAPASLHDFRAMDRYEFDPARFAQLPMPVLLLTGSESERQSYVTDDLAAALPDVRVVDLQGQAHIAQAMAPQLFVDTVSEFLLG